MIENENQYNITKQKLLEFQGALNKTKLNPHCNEAKYKITIECLENFIKEFEEDINKYEHKYFR